MENIGKRFNRLTVLDLVGKDKYGRIYRCKCDCGNIKDVKISLLNNGGTKSCGCLQKEVTSKRLKESNMTHGYSKTRLYKILSNMKARCYNKNTSSYRDYGDKGIEVCDEWRNSFESFRDWAYENGYNDTLTIDRIDSNGNYEPNNCRWITKSENTKYRNDECGIPILKSSFNDDIILKIKELRELGYTYKEIGNEIGCSDTHVRNLVNGKVRHFKNSK